MNARPADLAAERLKTAIEAVDFEHAPALAEAYGQAIREQIEATPDPRKRDSILEEARAFLEDRLHLARVLRAHVGAQYRAAAGLASYQNFANEQRSWHCEG
ncbi:MAG TPA: hypothetical protein VKX25_02480 [Bryobacteraceae bacterium]|jgi:hypothetical protein|nr:hypothetical protein [Bryobacteraceae bacterium]